MALFAILSEDSLVTAWPCNEEINNNRIGHLIFELGSISGLSQ